jgi:hypothetical protein
MKRGLLVSLDIAFADAEAASSLVQDCIAPSTGYYCMRCVSLKISLLDGNCMSASKISQEKATVKAPNSDSEIQRFAKKFSKMSKLPSGLHTVTSTGTNIFLTITSYKEKCMQVGNEYCSKTERGK